MKVADRNLVQIIMNDDVECLKQLIVNYPINLSDNDKQALLAHGIKQQKNKIVNYLLAHSPLDLSNIRINFDALHDFNLKILLEILQRKQGYLYDKNIAAQKLKILLEYLYQHNIYQHIITVIEYELKLKITSVKNYNYNYQVIAQILPDKLKNNSGFKLALQISLAWRQQNLVDSGIIYFLNDLVTHFNSDSNELPLHLKMFITNNIKLDGRIYRKVEKFLTEISNCAGLDKEVVLLKIISKEAGIKESNSKKIKQQNNSKTENYKMAV